MKKLERLIVESLALGGLLIIGFAVIGILYYAFAAEIKVQDGSNIIFSIGAEHPWVDSMVPGMAFRNGVSAPSLEDGPTADIQILSFAKDADNIVHGTLQLNHNYAEGTDIKPHIHLWFPTDAASTAETNVWQITYMWGNIATNGFVGSPVTQIITNSGQVYAGEHRVIPFSTITGTGKTISSVLMITVERTGTDGYDVYDDYIGFIGFDVHYQRDTPGSSTEWAK